jgi:hypothetical protein
MSVSLSRRGGVVCGSGGYRLLGCFAHLVDDHGVLVRDLV